MSKKNSLNKTLAGLLVAGTSLAVNYDANATGAIQTQALGLGLKVPDCTSCHTGMGTRDNVKPGFRDAYRQDTTNLSKLKPLLGGGSTPTTTPATYDGKCGGCHGTPAASSNKSGKSASITKYAINALGDPFGTMGASNWGLKKLTNADLNSIVTELGGAADLPATPRAVSKDTPNTAPTITIPLPEYNVDAGANLSIPLGVFDAEDDAFKLTGNVPTGATTSEIYTPNGYGPTIDFKWTPTVAQANKIYTISFTAKEYKDEVKTPKSSKPVTVKIHVWPAGDHVNIKQLIISKAKWTDANGGELQLAGKVILNGKMLPGEKAKYLQDNNETVDFIPGIKGTGIAVGTNQPIVYDAQGNWTTAAVALPATSNFSCTVTLQVEGATGAKATKAIAGAPKTCLKK